MNTFLNLKDKNILITGASSGIGKQCAIAASKLGATLILIARHKERLEEAHRSLEKGRHILFSQDITEYSKIEDIVSSSVEKIGKISGFIHSAGIEMTLPLKSMSPSHYEKLFSINVISGFELAKAISNKKYLDERGASFVFISSVLGISGEKGRVGYCSSKGALIPAVKAMALELAAKSIRVNCISPGVVETEMTRKMFDGFSEETKKTIVEMHPLGLGRPEDIANACMFLLSDGARWITGINLIIDGGYSAR